MVSTDKFEQVLTVLGALVPLFSAVASLVNHSIRTAQAESKPVSGVLLVVGAVLNVVALNLDKAIQLARTVKGGTASTGGSGA